MSSPADQLAARLETFLTTKAGVPVRVGNLRQLTGGASRDTWSFDADLGGERVGLVLRRRPGGRHLRRGAQPRGRVSRAGNRSCRRRSCPPAALARPDAAVLGAPFFVMDRLEGESVGRRVVREPALAEARRKLPRQMGEQLARIHAIDPATLPFLPRPEPGHSPALHRHRAFDPSTGGFARTAPGPGTGHALARRHAPGVSGAGAGPRRLPRRQPDGRGGGAGRRLRLGVRPRRRPRGGPRLAVRPLVALRPGRASTGRRRRPGRDIRRLRDSRRPQGGRRRVHFWEVLGNFRWAVGCIVQADRHLSGKAASVELASLGRRTARWSWNCWS